ncbi:regulatory protein RecX [Sphingomonas sp. SRS2]|uniref:regulatory protein RecX n=1 Tax=Sphingomonas sp. SRS2 TaxID=133190 RepID=UPI0006184BD9|nr:regulatory protein RecX [Sphingomonas sp. SRS2]KKC27379.1 RecX family transcriptional regulator [Sphingomonas sp. SRS2]
MPRSAPRTPKPYDDAALERAALDYAARYATTRAKLAAFLRRKVRERGWAGEGEAPVEALVERFSQHGYVDDRAFASARAESLLRRGYGARRIGTALRAAGIGDDVAGELRERIGEGAEDAATGYARRKRIGPFSGRTPDMAEKRRWIAAMARAGHPMDIILRVLGADPGEEAY